MSLDAAPRDGRSAGPHRPRGGYDASRPSRIMKQGVYSGGEKGIGQFMVIGRRG